MLSFNREIGHLVILREIFLNHRPLIVVNDK